MDASWFDALPVLCKNRKHSVEEIHVLLCPLPRPVAVKIGAGYRKLPEDMWPMGELAARALQGVEIYEMEACLIGGFLAQILCQAIRGAGVLETSPCMDGRALLSLLLAKAKPAEMTTQQRIPNKRQTGAAAKNATHANEECSDAAPTVVAEHVPHANEECSDAAPNVAAENAPHANEECSNAVPGGVGEISPHANEECSKEAPSDLAEHAQHESEPSGDGCHEGKKPETAKQRRRRMRKERQRRTA